MSWKVNRFHVDKKLKLQLVDMVTNGFYRLTYGIKSKKIGVGKVKDSTLASTRVKVPMSEEMTNTWSLLGGRNMWCRGDRYLMPTSYNKLIFTDKKKAKEVAERLNRKPDAWNALLDIWRDTNWQFLQHGKEMEDMFVSERDYRLKRAEARAEAKKRAEELPTGETDGLPF
ncbi:MAG: hypothetical protein MJZ20_06960 [Bacteroidaceae bacterium]|nr:hypothetical protein [Bacteroidaceae bacterium]